MGIFTRDDDHLIFFPVADHPGADQLAAAIGDAIDSVDLMKHEGSRSNQLIYRGRSDSGTRPMQYAWFNSKGKHAWGAAVMLDLTAQVDPQSGDSGERGVALIFHQIRKGESDRETAPHRSAFRDRVLGVLRRFDPETNPRQEMF